MPDGELAGESVYEIETQRQNDIDANIQKYELYVGIETAIDHERSDNDKNNRNEWC